MSGEADSDAVARHKRRLCRVISEFTSGVSSRVEACCSATPPEPNPFWRIDTRAVGFRTEFNSGKSWNTHIISIYNEAMDNADQVGDFTIHHTPSGTAFRVPLMFAMAGSRTISSQIKSGLQLNCRRIEISGSETQNPEVVRTIIIYFFTGFLIDSSITDVKTMTQEGAKHVSLSFSVVELYRVARFLQAESLLEEIREHLVDVHRGHISNGEEVRFHLAALLYLAQESMDPDLMSVVVRTINKRARSCIMLLTCTHRLLRRETWEAVMDECSDSFMFWWPVIVAYSALFDVPMHQINDMVKRYRDKYVSRGRQNMGYSSILADFVPSIAMNGAFTTSSAVSHLHYPMWIINAMMVSDGRTPPEYGTLVCAMRYCVLHTVIHSQIFASFAPQWVKDVSSVAMGLESVVSAPSQSKLERISAITSIGRQPDIVAITLSHSRHSSLSSFNSKSVGNILSSVLPMDFLSNPQVPGTIIEGMTLMHTMRNLGLRLSSVKVGGKRQREDPDGVGGGGGGGAGNAAGAAPDADDPDPIESDDGED